MDLLGPSGFEGALFWTAPLKAAPGLPPEGDISKKISAHLAGSIALYR
jgi:hypothetical protein